MRTEFVELQQTPGLVLAFKRFKLVGPKSALLRLMCDAPTRQEGGWCKRGQAVQVRSGSTEPASVSNWTTWGVGGRP